MKNIWILAMIAVLTFIPSLSQAKGERVDQQLQVPANTRVVIDTMRGQVDIIGTNENLAQVSGTLDEKAEKFIFELTGDTLTIKVEMPKRGNYNNNEGNDLVIRLPNTARVEAKSVSANFDIHRFAKRVSVNTVSGNIKAKQLTGGMQLESVSGDIDSEGLAGEVFLKSVSGDVKDKGSDSSRATYATVSGDLEAATNAPVIRIEAVSGDIKLAAQAVDSLHVNSVSGDAKVRLQANEQARVNIESVSGDVEVQLVGTVNADLEARTNAGGSIINDLTKDKVQESKYGVGERLLLELGERSGSMSFRTVSGDIALKRGSR